MNTVSEADVPTQLEQFSIDVQFIAICTAVRIQRETIRTGLKHILPGSEEERPNLLVAIEEKLKRCNTRSTDRAMASRVAWMCR